MTPDPDRTNSTVADLHPWQQPAATGPVVRSTAHNAPVCAKAAAFPTAEQMRQIRQLRPWVVWRWAIMWPLDVQVAEVGRPAERLGLRRRGGLRALTGDLGLHSDVSAGVLEGQ